MWITVTDLDDDPVDSLTMTLEGKPYELGAETRPIFELDPDNNSTFDGKEYRFVVSGLENGFRYYEIEAIVRGDSSVLEGVFAVDKPPDIKNTWHTPIYSIDETDIVTFKINFSDPDDNWPDYVDLMIYRDLDNDTTTYGPFALEEADTADKILRNGKLYQISKSFAPDGDDYGAADYYYIIEVSDGFLTASSSGRNFKVNEADSPPNLTAAKVSPRSGGTTTQFTFEVVYSDAEGEAPTEIYMLAGQNKTDLEPIDPAEPTKADYIAGVTYGVKMEINYGGKYPIKFHAKSGTDSLGVTVIPEEPMDVVHVSDNIDDSTSEEEKAANIMLWITIGLVVPIAIGVIAGLITRTKRPPKSASEEEKEGEKDEDEDVEWSFEDEEEEGEDEEAIEWE
jgi:hypothetical protein